MWEMEEATTFRQLIGQIQELWELYGSRAFPHHPPHQRWWFLDLEKGSVSSTYYNILVSGINSSNTKRMEILKPPPLKKSRKERTTREKQNRIASCSEMEQQIWKEFPEDLFEAVIARLPIASFFRFRTVCKKWNSLLASQSFSLHCAEVPHTSPWFYTITHENVSSGAMYDPALKKWHLPTSPLLSNKMIILPVASAGGLVCFMDNSHKIFYVCNPLTQSLKELPARSIDVWSRIAVGMTLNGCTADDGYNLLWLGCNGEHEVYDSRMNGWTRPGNIPPNIKLPLSLNFKSQAVSIGRTLYFMRSNPDGIVSYDMVNGTWKQFAVPTPQQLTDCTLAVSKGQLMLVGLLTKNAANCVCIWELQKMMLLWKEVDRMPNILCLDFYGKHVRMTCLGNKDLLMFSLWSRQMNRLVTYDVSNRDWQKVPGCILPRGRKRQWIACGTAFYPCLGAAA